MKALIIIAVIAVLILAGWKGYDYWIQVKESREAQDVQVVPFDPKSLGELPPPVEKALEEAKRGGAGGLRHWLDKYGKPSKLIPEARIQWVKVDYLLEVSMSRPGEARKLYAELKSSVTPGSKVYVRLKKLQKTYEGGAEAPAPSGT